MKRRYGYALYMLEAFKIWVTNPFSTLRSYLFD